MINIDGYPLFRCNRALFLYWTAGGVLQRNLANTISKTWKTGVVVLTPRLYAVGTVDPRGNPNPLEPPYRQFEMWQVCNAPSVIYKECACRLYYDPESGGQWGDRDDRRAREQYGLTSRISATGAASLSRSLQPVTANPVRTLTL